MGDHLDRLIDETARALTAGTPSPALRVNVRARIDAARPTSAWRWAIAASAVALVLIAVGTVWTMWTAASRQPLDAHARPVIELMTAVPSDAAAAQMRTSEPARPRLSQIAPVDLLEVAPIEIELLEIPMPLRADRLEVEPLVIE